MTNNEKPLTRRDFLILGTAFTGFMGTLAYMAFGPKHKWTMSEGEPVREKPKPLETIAENAPVEKPKAPADYYDIVLKKTRDYDRSLVGKIDADLPFTGSISESLQNRVVRGLQIVQDGWNALNSVQCITDDESSGKWVHQAVYLAPTPGNIVKDSKSGSVVFSVNEMSVAGAYLYFHEGDYLFEHSTYFTSPLSFNVEKNGRVPSIEGQILPVLGKNFEILSACLEESGNSNVLNLLMKGANGLCTVRDALSYYPDSRYGEKPPFLKVTPETVFPRLTIDDKVVDDAVAHIAGRVHGINRCERISISHIYGRVKANSQLGSVYIPPGRTLSSAIANPAVLPGRFDIMYVGENKDGDHVVRLFVRE